MYVCSATASEQYPAVDRDKVTTRHCGLRPLEARVARVYFRGETKRNENSTQTSDL